MIFPKFLVAASGMLLATTAGLNAENWPWFRGPSRQGISTEKEVPVFWGAQSNIVWKTEIAGMGWSSPIVLDGKVFLTAAEEEGKSFRLVCVDRQNGRVLWNKPVFEQDLTSRREGRNSYATPTPATDSERVYVFAFDGSLAAFALDGNPVWTNRENKYYSQHGPGVSPVLYRDLLIVPFDMSSPGPDKLAGWQKPWDQSFILALDKRTGKERWRGKRGLSRIAHVTPNILSDHGRDQLVSAAGDVVQGHNLDTGERVWTVATSGEGVVPSVVAGDGWVFCASGFGKPSILAVRAGGMSGTPPARLAWEYKKDVPMIPTFLYLKPHLYTISEGGVALCLKADDGALVWRQKLEGHFSASPVYADGRIYYLSDEGDTHVIQAGPEFKLVAKNSMGETCQASLAISEGRIFLRSEKHLYCIGRSR